MSRHDNWTDHPLPEDAAIDEAFPTRSGRHDLYAEAARMVGAKRSKGALVALVNCLLHSVDAGDKRHAAAMEALVEVKRLLLEQGHCWPNSDPIEAIDKALAKADG